MYNNELVWEEQVSLNKELLQKVPTWIAEYNQFLTHNTRDTGNIAINSLGLVGGSFVTDDPKYSYTPPTTSASEAQLLTIRGCLQSYIATKEQYWLTRAEKLTNALFKYYYPYETIPLEPDETWVPHWLVNVTEPFTSREWKTDGVANFVNGKATVTFDKVFKIWSARTLDSYLEYDWTPDAPIVGTEYAIANSVIHYGKSRADITLEEPFTGELYLVYTSETGPIINVGDKCEAFPVWRPLEEGEIACAVDALPWAIDVYKLWYQITNDEKWLRAIESTKLSLKVSADITNVEYFLKGKKDDELVLADGVTSFSDRTIKETYSNQDNKIIINYPASTGSATFGTWVGNRLEFTNNRYIDAMLGSSKVGKVKLLLDEDAEYVPNKRWVHEFYLSGNGLNELEYFEFYPEDFYQSDEIKWGIGYGKSNSGDAIKSTNSSLNVSNIIGDINGKNRMFTHLEFTRGDEGGWLGWSQFMFGLWGHWLPYDISYKSNNAFNIIITDSAGVKWTYQLPQTNNKWETVKLSEGIFTPDSAEATTFAEGNYQSVVLDSIDENSMIDIDYIGNKKLMTVNYFSSVHFEYSEEEELDVAIEYIKPAPSREPIPFAPYIIPFDYHLINYNVSHLRGAVYTGYQVPWVFNEGIFPNKQLAINTNLDFLRLSQHEYERLNEAKGFFAPIYWWDYRDDYGENEPNTFGIEGNWGPVWGGFQYRTFSDVARVFEIDQDNETAYEITLDFAKGVNTFWSETYTGFPTAFDDGKLPYNNQTDSHMVSNFMRGLVYTLKSNRLSTSDINLIHRLINKCLDYLNHYRIPVNGFKDSLVEGTWSPNPSQNVWFEYWGGDILDGLSVLHKEIE